MKRTHIYNGNCHCGNIHFTFSSEKNENEFTPRTCSCSFCRHHGGSYISDPAGKVELNFKNKDKVSFYQFGHKTAKFVICKNCGSLMMAISTIEERDYAVINIRSMLDHEFSGKDTSTNFDGETIMGRLERRAENWIGHVVIND